MQETPITKFISTDARQIINMGGPYIGNIVFEGKTIADDCIADNYVYKEDKNLLFFVQHHLVGNYRYFTINFFNLANETTYHFEREFDMVYLSKFINDHELEIFSAFHDQLPGKRRVLI